MRIDVDVWASKVLLAIPRRRSRCPIAAMRILRDVLHSTAPVEDTDGTADGMIDERRVLLWISSQLRSISVDDEAADELLREVAGRYACVRYVPEWWVGGPKPARLPVTLSDELEVGYCRNLRRFMRDEWEVCFDDMVLRRSETSLPLLRTCTEAPRDADLDPAAAATDEEGATPTFRLRSSSESARWVIECFDSGVQETVGIVMSFVLECILERWHEDGSCSLCEVIDGDGCVRVLPSTAVGSDGFWEWEFQQHQDNRVPLTMRWKLLRFLVSRDADADPANTGSSDIRAEEAAAVFARLVVRSSSLLGVTVDSKPLIDDVLRNGFCTLRDDLSVEVLREMLQLPFVDPKTFRYVGRSPPRSLHVRGMVVPLSPLNEWLLDKGEDRLFLEGQWQSFRHGAVAFGDGTIAWLEQHGEKVLRFVCRGVPMELSRRVLQASHCPHAFLRDDVVVFDDVTVPEVVMRTWGGDRSDAVTNAYFGLGKASSRDSSATLMRRGLNADVGAIETHENSTSRFVKKILAVGKYAYKYPVTLNPDGQELSQ